MRFASGIFLVLLFFGALFWAKQDDPFSRNWFTLKTADHAALKCVSVLPKPIRKRPIVIYAHGWGHNLDTDGNKLRQMAEMGLATVSLQYNQTNTGFFPAEMEAVLDYLGRQKWADTNSIAWVGFSMGAEQTLDFALKYPALQPQLLVQLSGAGLSEGQNTNALAALRCPVLLIHSDQDAIFPVENTQRLSAVLQSNGLPEQLTILHGVTHGMDTDIGLVFREIGEYCLAHLQGQDAWQHYLSLAQWQAEARPLWLYWLPAFAWLGGWLAWRRLGQVPPAEKRKLQLHEIALRWLAAFLATWALGETALHLATPHFAVTQSTVATARRFLVQPKDRADFESLAGLNIWQSEQLKSLLDHAELAHYNRNELINWKLNDGIYRDYVLSPVITGSSNEPLNWRRPLWEEFYPRIRHENEPLEAARIVVRHLRERVTIAQSPSLPQTVPSIWLRQITDPTGFEIIYVAALRSVGVGARLNPTGQAEIWTGEKWVDAPRPVSATLL